MRITWNGILTLVECKRYCDSRVKREVYPQALNCPADLQAQLVHFSNEPFLREFFALVARAKDSSFPDLESVILSLSEDPAIGKNKGDWRRQFASSPSSLRIDPAD